MWRKQKSTYRCLERETLQVKPVISMSLRRILHKSHFHGLFKVEIQTHSPLGKKCMEKNKAPFNPNAALLFLWGHQKPPSWSHPDWSILSQTESVLLQPRPKELLLGLASPHPRISPQLWQRALLRLGLYMSWNPVCAFLKQCWLRCRKSLQGLHVIPCMFSQHCLNTSHLLSTSRLPTLLFLAMFLTRNP